MISTLNSCVGLAEVKTKDSSATFCCNYTTWLLAVTSVTRPELQNTPLLLNSDMTHTETDDSLWPTPIMTTHFSWVVQSVAGNTSFLVSFRFQTCALTEPEKKPHARNFTWICVNRAASLSDLYKWLMSILKWLFPTKNYILIRATIFNL